MAKSLVSVPDPVSVSVKGLRSPKMVVRNMVADFSIGELRGVDWILENALAMTLR